MSERAVRLREEIKREVSVIIQRQVKDPRLGMVSVTDVDLSRDFSYCKIFVSILGDENQREQSLAGLRRATGFIRSELGKRLRVRHVPEISFSYDASLEHGARINAILKEIGPDGGDDS